MSFRPVAAALFICAITAATPAQAGTFHYYGMGDTSNCTTYGGGFATWVSCTARSYMTYFGGGSSF